MTDRTPHIETGALVRLKSGGPVMTVQAASLHIVYCVWFEEGRQQQGTFARETLDIVPATDHGVSGS